MNYLRFIFTVGYVWTAESSWAANEAMFFIIIVIPSQLSFKFLAKNWNIILYIVIIELPLPVRHEKEQESNKLHEIQSFSNLWPKHIKSHKKIQFSFQKIFFLCVIYMKSGNRKVNWSESKGLNIRTQVENRMINTSWFSFIVK